ncbi:unnamed protein product [Closterium sp. Naga37s-1]|nr:unnamed protein product [Closterium sp. Naga37s-1]
MPFRHRRHHHRLPFLQLTPHCFLPSPAGASFGESMYGLRRISTVPHRPSPSQAALRTGGAAGGAAGAEGAGRGERAAGGQEGGSASYGMSRKQGRFLFSFWSVPLPSCALCLLPARGKDRPALYIDSTTPHTPYHIPGAAALPARQAPRPVCRPLEAEAGPLFRSTQNTPYPLPHTAYQVLLPYLRAKLHALFAFRQRQRQARALWVGGDGADEGWGGVEEGEWGTGRDGGNNAALGQGDGDGYGDEYGGAMGGEERSESGSSPGSMGSVGSLHGHEQSADGLGTDGLRDETPGGGGVAAAAAAARVTDGREEGGEGEEEVGGQGGQVVTGGAAAGSSDARGNGGRRSSAIGSSSSRSSARGSRRWRQVVRVLRWLQRRAVRGAAAAYPWVQAPYEGVCLLYQLLYVMDATPHYSPVLHLLSLSLRRATPQELMHASSSLPSLPSRQMHASSSLPSLASASASDPSPLPSHRAGRGLFLHLHPPSARVRAPPGVTCNKGEILGQAVQAALLKALYFTMDYAQTSVIAAVFAFKVAPAGIPVPADRSLCPLCLCRRTNPTAPATSGFIFCYPCIFAYVDKVGCDSGFIFCYPCIYAYVDKASNPFGRCPITHHPTTVDQLRRLFPDA